MLLFILGIGAFIYIVTIGFISYNLRNNAIQEAKLLADTYAVQKANQVKAKLDEDMAITRSMAYIMQDYVNLPLEQREDLQYSLMRNIVQEYPRYEAVWMSWQLQYIDSTWFNEYGRLSINCYWDHDEIKSSEEKKDLEGFDYDGLYYRLYDTQKELLTEPYEFDSYDLNSDKMLLAVSPTAPMLKEGKTIGVIGVDMSLEGYSEMTNIDVFETGYAFLLSHDGTVVAHPNDNVVNLSIDSLAFTKALDFDIKQKLKEGEFVSLVTYDEEMSSNVYVSFAPISVGRSEKPWGVGVIIPFSEITSSFNNVFILTILVGMLGLVLLSFIIWNIASGITTSIDNTNVLLSGLAKGNLSAENTLAVTEKNELGEMANSLHILQSELYQKAEFSRKIGEGDFEANFVASSDEDVLGKSLLGMRDNLRKSKIEETHRRWTNEGLAAFGEKLQMNNDNMQDFCSDIISDLVKYLNIVQGGLFLINNDDEDDKYIELLGAYAYERRKFIDKRIEIGEGLVGQCVLEKKHIYLREVPDQYVNVTSGLGKSNPNSILLVPLSLNEEVYGVIELISFKEFKEFEIDFIKNLAENIASTISSIKINQRTKKLLEQSQIQGEELRAQEEEMRQNMEELQATQEEMARKEQDYVERIELLEEELSKVKDTNE
ncbi:MAG: GAF domain-containing protein [Cyclobacteriaceae bacterium]|nr:GAF domain-containing protein [Cyclobacteriaceae bacterium]